MAEPGSVHAILSPSGADRWVQCPGSVLLSDGLPDTSGPYAIDGTDHHELAALCLEQKRPASDYVGCAMQSGAIATEENCKYLDEGYLTPLTEIYAVDGSLLVEERCSISHLTGEKDAFGTSDAVVIKQDRELIVGDLKFGRGVEVSPEHNKQLQIYALAVIRKHELETEIDQARLIIFQPRVGNGAPQEWVIGLPALLVFAEEVKRAATPILKALPKYRVDKINVLPLNPSEKACRFCKVKGTCPALQNFVDATMAEGFEAEVGGLSGASVVDGVRLGKAMDAVDLMEIWIKGVQATVEIELLAGRPVIGADGPYKLVTGKMGNRKWSDESEAEEMLTERFRMKIEDAYKMTVISPSAAEKLLAKEHPRRWVQLEKLVTQSEGSKHVAKATDKRPAIETRPMEEGFEAEPPQEEELF